MSDEMNFGIDDEDENEDAGSSIGVIKVQKRDYAVSLFWNSVDVATDAMKEAREMVASGNISADFCCVRTGFTPQFGLGFKSAGHKSGMPSLAAHLAANKSDSWIGLFEVADGYYLVAVRDGAILAECDNFYTDKETAVTQYQFFQNQSGWQEEIAPKDLDIPGTSEVKIESILEGKPPSRLVEISRSKNLIRMVILGVVALCVLVGGYIYVDSLEQERIRLEMEAQFRKAQEAISPKEEIVIPPMPWEGKPIGVTALEKCRDAVYSFRMNYPGWTVQKMFCQGPTIAASVNRDKAIDDGGAPITWVEEVLKKDGNMNVSVDYPPEGTGQLIRIQWNLENLPKHPIEIPQIKLNTIKRKIQKVFENRMTRINFGMADANEFWKGMTFTFTTKMDPMSFGDLIAALPGVMIHNVEYDPNQGEWKVEGKIYEQLELPKDVNVKR